jgi:hypothetical protein
MARSRSGEAWARCSSRNPVRSILLLLAVIVLFLSKIQWLGSPRVTR